MLLMWVLSSPKAHPPPIFRVLGGLRPIGWWWAKGANCSPPYGHNELAHHEGWMNSWMDEW